MDASLATWFQRTKKQLKRENAKRCACMVLQELDCVRGGGGKGSARHRVEHILRRKQLMINLYRNNKQTFFEIDKPAPEI
jgi:hypothetical protein